MTIRIPRLVLILAAWFVASVLLGAVAIALTGSRYSVATEWVTWLSGIALGMVLKEKLFPPKKSPDA